MSDVVEDFYTMTDGVMQGCELSDDVTALGRKSDDVLDCCKMKGVVDVVHYDVRRDIQ